MRVLHQAADGAAAITDGVDEVSGEARLETKRGGRLVGAFDLKISLTWQARLDPPVEGGRSPAQHCGWLRFSEVSSHNAVEEYELELEHDPKTAPTPGSAAEARLLELIGPLSHRAALQKGGLTRRLWEQLAEFGTALVASSEPSPSAL